LSRGRIRHHSDLKPDNLTGAESHENIPPSLPSPQHCQSIALVSATYLVSIWDFRPYLWDLTDDALSPLKRIRLPLTTLARHIWHLVGIRLPDRLRGTLEITPTANLVLQPGDWVRVKNLDEIRRTLDSSGENRGLVFTKEMRKFCGQKFSVLRTVDQMIVEGTGEMRRLDNTVILKGATCDGNANSGCQRNCYLMWRTIWLHRM
jgi:hypothetical protein